MPQLWMKSDTTDDRLREATAFFYGKVLAFNPDLRYSVVHSLQYKFSDIHVDTLENNMSHFIAQVRRHTKCGSPWLRRDV